MPVKSPALRKLRATPRSISTSPTPTAGRKAGSTPTPKQLASLGATLPTEWASSSFAVVRAGKHWGLANTCPVCGARPPKELTYGHRRWRWLTVHLTTHAGRK
jgi:hypothetical protein